MLRNPALIDLVKLTARPDSPLVIAFAFAIPALWLLMRPSSATARRLIVAVALGYWFIATPIGAGLLVAGLGHGLAPLESAADAQGANVVVVLSGGAQSYILAGMVVGIPARESVLRALEAARVFKLIDARRLIVSGGRVRQAIDLKPESETLRDVAVKAGVPDGAVEEERKSTTTYQQVRELKTILTRDNVKRFVLVTSPTHMRRSIAVFQANGLNPVPSVAPLRSDHLKRGPWVLPDHESLSNSATAIYDYAAMVYYWASGRLSGPSQ